MPKCEICGYFTLRRKALQPYSADEIRNLDAIVMVCNECYVECMRKCISIVGQEKAHLCKAKCEDYFAAKTYAENQRTRTKKATAQQTLQYQAMEPYIKGSVSSWPKVPQQR